MEFWALYRLQQQVIALAAQRLGSSEQTLLFPIADCLRRKWNVVEERKLLNTNILEEGT